MLSHGDRKNAYNYVWISRGKQPKETDFLTNNRCWCPEPRNYSYTQQFCIWTISNIRIQLDTIKNIKFSKEDSWRDFYYAFDTATKKYATGMKTKNVIQVTRSKIFVIRPPNSYRFGIDSGKQNEMLMYKQLIEWK